jgi:hypothetical protein
MSKLKLAIPSIVLAFVAYAIVWRGGKALDAVWLQALLASGVTLHTFWKRKERNPLPIGFLLLLAALCAWTVVSFVLSSTKNYGFDEVLQTVSLLLLALWAAHESHASREFPVRFAKVVSVAAIVACGIGVVVYALQPVSRFVGTFFDYRFHTDYWPNAWAEFVLFAWPLLAWSLWHKRSIAVRRVVLNAIVLGFVFGCLFLSYSRGGFIAFLGQVVLLLLLLIWICRDSIEWKKLLGGVVLSILIAAVTFFSVNHLRSNFHTVQSVISKATFSSDEGTSSVSERALFWHQALTLAKKKPLFGWGPYSFRFVQTHVQDGILATSDHAHNVFFKYASERGAIAALLLFTILVWSVASGFLTLQRSEESGVSLTIALIVGIGGVIAHNLIDYNLQFVGIALPLWIGIGILMSTPRPGVIRTTERRVILFIAWLLLFFTLFEGVNLALSSLARRAEARGDSVGSLTWYERTNVSFFSRDGWLARASTLLSLDELPQAETAINHYLALNEQDGRAWRLLGDIYATWNEPAEAVRAYEKAYDYARLNDLGITRGLVTQLSLVDRSVLFARRHEFDELLNDFGLAISQNSHFIALGSNVEELLKLTEAMATLFPDDAALYRGLAQRVQQHAKEERATFGASPKGILW